MKKFYVKDLKEPGMRIRERFAIKFKKPPVEYKGKPGKWFELRLTDRTGEITAKYWGRDKEETVKLYESLVKGDVVFVDGELQEFPPESGQITISIDGSEGELRRCLPGEYELEDFVSTTEKDVHDMVSQIVSMLSEIENPYLKRLVERFTSDSGFMKLFMESPAAMHYHQNYVGGLVEHTLNVMKIASAICDTHKELDRDLVLTGAFLHDIGKIKELETTATAIDVSREGMLIGHTVLSYEMVLERIKDVEGFPEDLKLKVLHIILSHHGKLENGSPKEPQLPEAVAVYQADQCDAKVDIYLRLKREARTEDPWIWDRKVGHVYLE